MVGLRRGNISENIFLSEDPVLGYCLICWFNLLNMMKKYSIKMYSIKLSTIIFIKLLIFNICVTDIIDNLFSMSLYMKFINIFYSIHYYNIS